jgi:hypothetical protein
MDLEREVLGNRSGAKRTSLTAPRGQIYEYMMLTGITRSGALVEVTSHHTLTLFNPDIADSSPR